MHKLCIYTSSDYPYGGAPENFVRLMARGIYASGVDVNIVRIHGSSNSALNDTPIIVNDLIKCALPQKDIFKFFYYFLVIFTIPFSLFRQRFNNKVDTVILYGIEYSYLVFPFFWAAKMIGLNLFRIVTDLYPDKVLSPVWWKFFKYKSYLRQLTHIDKKLDGIIVLSIYLHDIEISNGVIEDNIIVIPHFIEIKDVPYHQDIGSCTIGYCGSAIVDNGIIDLIKAFAVVHKSKPQTKLIIIGSDTPELTSSIHEYCSSFLSDIVITGFVDKDAVAGELSRCSILVNPRIMNPRAMAGFPTKLGEYFSARKPVVSTNVGDIPYYFTNYKELVISDHDNYLNLSEGILYLINNPSDARNIAEGGYFWAKEHLDYLKNSRILISFIYDTVHSRK